MRPAGTYRNKTPIVNQTEDLFILFFLQLRAECQRKIGHVRTCRPFFALHRLSVVKIGHLRMCKPFFAPPINAALGSKIFSNAAFRVNIIAHP